MLKDTFAEIFERDLLKLREEIGMYRDEADLWVLRGEIGNTAGNLCLHLVGNLNHFIGATLGNTGYVREREREFSDKNVPRENLYAAIGQTLEMLRNTFESMQEADFFKTFPLEKHGRVVSTDYMLTHLLTHLGYHLGQINYHRRMLSATGGG